MSKSNLVIPRTLPGFMELSPRDQIAFERIRAALVGDYEKNMFRHIIFPFRDINHWITLLYNKKNVLSSGNAQKGAKGSFS